MIDYECSMCHAVTSFPDIAAGSPIKCPECQEVGKLADQGIRTAPPGQRKAPPKIKHICPKCGAVGMLPLKMQGLQVRCPKCKALSAVADPDGDDDQWEVVGISKGTKVAKPQGFSIVRVMAGVFFVLGAVSLFAGILGEIAGSPAALMPELFGVAFLVLAVLLMILNNTQKGKE